ncbi:MAG: hypothetical protein V3V16_06060 [Melioribacteraceae bacterium]
MKSKKSIIVKLPHRIDEISGLAISNDGRLFCHDDERAVIYQLDYKTGKIIKRFQLGKYGLESDFEGMAIADEKFFLLSSDGILYEFEEGNDLEKVDFTEYNLGFNSKFEFEGLCYDSTFNSLLIVSKNYPGKKHKGNRAIYSFSLKNYKLDKSPKILIPLKELSKKNGIKDFYPSGITKHSASGDYFIISSKGQPSIVRITNSGKILNAYELDKKTFAQPEGIVFLSDSTLLVSNEAKGKRATLVKLKISEL